MKFHPFAACAALSLLSSSLPAQDVRQGIISYWPLDATPDEVVTPDLVSGYDLTLVNMDASNFVAGKRGNCATLDGATEMLVRNITPQDSGLPLHLNPSLTVCLWVKGLPQASERRIFSECSSTVNTPLYDIVGGTTGSSVNDVYVRTDANSAVVSHLKTTLPMLDDSWHHIAVTDNNGALRCYIDGALDPLTVNYARSVLTTDRLVIGALRRIADGNFFTGQVDDVAIWSRILTQPEIQEVATNGLTEPLSVWPLGPYIEGARVSLTLRRYGAGPFTYQWRHADADIPSATGATLIIPALTAATAGTYEALVDGVPAASTVLNFIADPPVALSTGIVSWWPANSMDSLASPPTTPDPWGGHALTCESMTVANLVPGKFDTALQFEASLAQRAYRTTGFPIFGNPAYSVAFWVKGKGINGDGTTQSDLRVFAESSTTSNNPLFNFGTGPDPDSTKLRVYVRSDTNTVMLAALSTTPVFDDNWHHIAWVDKNGSAKLYIDGVLDATPVSYVRTNQTWTFNQTTLGAITRSAVSHWFTGAMDDVATWNRALTWSEIQELHTSGVPEPVVAVPAEITVEPVSRTVWQGRPVTLSIQAVGTAPITYQWYRGPGLIPSATAPDYILTSAQPSDSGSYTCKITNTAGNDTSAPATLTVLPITGIESGLLSCWPLDAADTTTPDRVSSFDFTLQNMDAGMAMTPGIIGGALFFEGVDDLLVRTRTGAGNDIPVSTLTEFSVAFWVKGFGTGQLDRRIFSESSTVSTNPLFNIGTEIAGATNALSIYIRDDANTVRSNHPVSIAQPLDGAWHHVLWSDNNGEAQLYIDGVPDLAVSYLRSLKTLTTTTVGGIQRATPSHWFTGSVDEVCTWSRALTATEALHLYQEGGVIPLVLTNIELITGPTVRLTLTTTLGDQPWIVQETGDVILGPWATLNGVTFSPVTSGSFTAEFPAPPAGTRHFYRVVAP